MITQQIKEIAKKNNKKIGKETINALNLILADEIERRIKNASRIADFQGRTVIKKEDFVSD